MLGDGASHVGFVDEQGLDVGAAHGIGAVAEDHEGGRADALDGEFEGREAVELAEAVVQFLESAGRVVAVADLAEFDARCADAGLDVGDADDHDRVAALLETAGEGGHGIDVAGAGETECAESCHGDLRDVGGAVPLSVREGGAFGFGFAYFW